MADTFEGLEDDDLEEEADKEVDKILFEVTNGEIVGSKCACSPHNRDISIVFIMQDNLEN